MPLREAPTEGLRTRRMKAWRWVMTRGGVGVPTEGGVTTPLARDASSECAGKRWLNMGWALLM